MRLDCNLCGKFKPKSHFYNGVTSRCKNCHKANVKKVRESNKDYYLEYDRARSLRPDRVLARKLYHKRMKLDPDYISRNKIARIRWAERNKEKRQANIAVSNAVRDGRLKRPLICQVCCKTKCKIQAHHDNYSKPLNVRWLCIKCHSAHHKDSRSAVRTALPQEK